MTYNPLMPVALVLCCGIATTALCVVLLVRGPRRFRWAWRTAAVVTVTVMALGPSTSHDVPPEPGSAIDVFIVVDRTGSMAAEDWGDKVPRLEGVRLDLPALTQAVPGARYSIIGWDSTAVRHLPLTTDTRAVATFAQTLRQEISLYSAGSSLDRPLDSLTEALQNAAETNPDHLRLVFLLSDGEQTTQEDRRSFSRLDSVVDGGAVLGYGTAEGGSMRKYDGYEDPGPDTPYITDDTTGQTAISRIDEEALQGVAGELGVPYIHRTATDDLTLALDDLDPEQLVVDAGARFTVVTPLLWPFALVIGAIALVEMWVAVQSLPARRRREEDR